MMQDPEAFVEALPFQFYIVMNEMTDAWTWWMVGRYTHDDAHVENWFRNNMKSQSFMPRQRSMDMEIKTSEPSEIYQKNLNIE